MNGFDIFAKSIPGMVLLVGFVTLLPEIPGLDGSKFGNFAAFIISVSLIGLLIGEAVHKLTDSIERTIFIPLDKIRWLLFGLKYYVARLFPSFVFLNLEFPMIKGFLREIRMKFYWKFFIIFKNHRELFVELFVSNYAEYYGPFEHREKGELFNRFSASIRSVYNVDISSDHESLRNLYPSMMSHIYMSNAKLSKRHQVLFAFCRSMWMVFFLVTIGYLWVIFVGDPSKFSVPLAPDYVPFGRSFLHTEYPLAMIPGTTGLISLMFMASCGMYKIHYIEYIAADFPWVVDWESDQKEYAAQTRIGEY